ncbi:hypothetical protein BN14_10777 [Rhizoctonia solani AG-1 IB]|uniref:Transposase family Tnp2 protein n=1 Tax=Thanatephorus cucumeris (strain AG1-IB / isolate 7/3/14) TaxID=1108050 RepID=M5CC35_THACB|nr:hypothetical protein BN14_10777 [Rhizoctonia solani AG-1 IB]
MAQKLRYQAERKAEDNVLWDIFDGAHYNCLCGKRVVVGGNTLGHRYFSKPTNIALGLSSNGFGPFKSRKQSCWPLLVFNYNLPPSIRTCLENMLCLGIIPGPNSPKEINTFLEPFIDELELLARGVPAHNASANHPVTLHAYLLACFGDMPAVAKLMCMKGHNGKQPCWACRIRAVYASAGKRTYYTPLSQHFIPGIPRIWRYDPLNLPLRMHVDYLEQALHIGASNNNTTEARRSRCTGINSLSPLARIASLDFAVSFPHDFMHAMFENVVPMLLDLWTCTGKWAKFGLSDKEYHLHPDVWAEIGKACAASVNLINTCLAFEITHEGIQEVRTDFAQWVRDFEHLYVRNDKSWLRLCTLPLHSLLHIADNIKNMGPVWAYWAFPMERFCGALARASKSQRYPYSSLNCCVLQTLQLLQIKHMYNLTEQLDLED